MQNDGPTFSSMRELGPFCPAGTGGLVYTFLQLGSPSLVPIFFIKMNPIFKVSYGFTIQKNFFLN